jgi:hypothetical protein
MLLLLLACRSGKPRGELCFSDDECRSGVCFPEMIGDPSYGFCVERCRDDRCPSGEVCQGRSPEGPLCVPFDGTFGARCSSDTECTSRLCYRPDVKVDGRMLGLSFCAARCGDCPGECEQHGEEEICVPVAEIEEAARRFRIAIERSEMP